MAERKKPTFDMADIFILAILITVQFPFLPSIIIFLIYAFLKDEVFNKMLQPYCRRG
jgi:hypothetical protein